MTRIVSLTVVFALAMVSRGSAQYAPPPAQPGQTQPAQAQPAPPPPPAYGAQPPAQAPYYQGGYQAGPAPYPVYGAQPVPGPDGQAPAGYYYERRPRLGMIISGAALFGAAWLFTTLIAVPIGSERENPDALRVAIPIAGPFIGMNEFGSDTTENFIDGLLAFDGMIQAIGATVLIIGIATPKRRLVPLAAEGPRLSPVLGFGNAGLRVDF